MKKIFLLILLLVSILQVSARKREFRGAWIQCVNGQFQGMSTEAMQSNLLHQLDELQKDGVNAIIFQVRAECDALYASKYEPWSRFLTGVQGQAPSPYWDPLQWMVEQCHKRGMELHAWINPYRAKTKGTTNLVSNHIAIKHPERVFSYDNLFILNPGMPENRQYIYRVVEDIVNRYDIDGLHIDDYFYPYPAPGQQNYDDLYADVLMWVNNGWVDYNVPQLYWQIGHTTADYETLIKWWNKHASNRPLYIGEDIERTCKFADLNNPQSNQMAAKYRLHQQMEHVDGTVLWYSRLAVDNYGNYGTVLRKNYWKNPALPPLMPFLDNKAPQKVKSLKPVWTSDGYILFWKAPKAKKWGDATERYVVYKFNPGEKVDVENTEKILAITSETMYRLPYENGKTKYTYVVTSLDRVGNESKITKKKIKL